MPREASVRHRENVGPPAVAANTERQDMRMFEEEQRIADPPGAPVFDQRSLKRQCVSVRHPPQAADVERSSVLAHPTYCSLDAGSERTRPTHQPT